MIINNSAGKIPAAGGDPRKDAIRSQIKRLEGERRRVQKRLMKAMKATGGIDTAVKGKIAQSAGGGGGGVAPVSGIGTGTAAVSIPAAAGSIGTNTPENTRQLMTDLNSRMLAAQYEAPAGVSSGAVEAVHNLVQFQASIAPSSDSGSDPEEYLDPKQLMEKLELIELQIQSLQLRLEDDEKSVLSMEAVDDGDERDEAKAGVVQAATPTPAPIESAAVQEDGHVDGYA